MQIKHVTAIDLKPDISIHEKKHNGENGIKAQMETKYEPIDDQLGRAPVDVNSTDDDRSGTTDSDGDSKILFLPKITNTYSLRSKKELMQSVEPKEEIVISGSTNHKKTSLDGERLGSPRVVLVDIEPILSSVRMQRIQDTDNGMMPDMLLNTTGQDPPASLSKIPTTGRATDNFGSGTAQSTEKSVRRSLRLSKIKTEMQLNGIDHSDTENTSDEDFSNGNLAGISSTNRCTKDEKVESITARYFQKMPHGNGARAEKSTEKCVEATMECSLCGFTCNYDGNESADSLLLHLRAQHSVLESKSFINVAEIETPSKRKNRSIVWDFFTKRRDTSGNERNFCLLCDYQCIPTGSASTGTMLIHLHKVHNHMQLRFKCGCIPPCK